MAVPVHVIAGFLGSGKTTTLLGMLRQRPSDERVAIVVNDFGESAVDQQSVAGRGLQVTEIRGACVCCTAPEGFVASVGELLRDVKPDRIFVEPTGLARPADLIDTLRRAPYRDDIALGPLVVLVDPHVLAADDGELAEQAAVADVLVANRTDLASDSEMAAFDRWAEGLWPPPLRVLRTTMGALPDDVVDWPEGTGPRAPAAATPHTHAHHDFVAHSRVWPPDTVFTRTRLVEHMQRLADAPVVARAKGMFRTDEGVALIEVAGGTVHEGPSGYRRDSRVDVILHGADHPDTSVLDGFDTALQTDDERDRAGTRIEVAFPDGNNRLVDRASLAALPRGVPDISELIDGRAGAAARVAELFANLQAPADVSVVVVALDGYATPPVPIGALQTAVLLHSLDGDPLPTSKGGPFRLLIPGDAGPGGPCANVKGVVRIALRDS